MTINVAVASQINYFLSAANIFFFGLFSVYVVRCSRCRCRRRCFDLFCGLPPILANDLEFPFRRSKIDDCI